MHNVRAEMILPVTSGHRVTAPTTGRAIARFGALEGREVDPVLGIDQFSPKSLTLGLIDFAKSATNLSAVARCPSSAPSVAYCRS